MSTVVRKKKAVVVVRKRASSSRAVVRAFQTGTQVQLLDKRNESEKRKRLAHLISENFGKKKPLTMEQMMLQAGYSESTARTQAKQFFQAARDEPEVQDHLARLKRIRDKLLRRVEETAEKAAIGAIGFPLQVIEKSIALLEGKPTDRIEHTLEDEEKGELLQILRDNE